MADVYDNQPGVLCEAGHIRRIFLAAGWIGREIGQGDRNGWTASGLIKVRRGKERWVSSFKYGDREAAKEFGCRR
jgi:hypothetical protein